MNDTPALELDAMPPGGAASVISADEAMVIVVRGTLQSCLCPLCFHAVFWHALLHPPVSQR